MRVKLSDLEVMEAGWRSLLLGVIRGGQGAKGTAHNMRPVLLKRFQLNVAGVM